MSRETDVDPNTTQVGGDHYKSAEFQPWDWASARRSPVGLGNYECMAIKYIVRFRKKDGIHDLKKAIHYIDKALYEHADAYYVNSCTASNLLVRDFNKQNECDRFQSEAIHMLVQWREAAELREVKKIIEELIQCELDDDFNHHHEPTAYICGDTWKEVPLVKLEASDKLAELVANPPAPSDHLMAAAARYHESERRMDMLSELNDNGPEIVPLRPGADNGPPLEGTRVYTLEEARAQIAADEAKAAAIEIAPYKPLPPKRFPKAWDAPPKHIPEGTDGT